MCTTVAIVLAAGAARRNVHRALHELLAQTAHQLRTPTATLVLELDAERAAPR